VHACPALSFSLSRLFTYLSSRSFPLPPPQIRNYNGTDQGGGSNFAIKNRREYFPEKKYGTNYQVALSEDRGRIVWDFKRPGEYLQVGHTWTLYAKVVMNKNANIDVNTWSAYCETKQEGKVGPNNSTLKSWYYLRSWMEVGCSFLTRSPLTRIASSFAMLQPAPVLFSSPPPSHPPYPPLPPSFPSSLPPHPFSCPSPRYAARNSPRAPSAPDPAPARKLTSSGPGGTRGSRTGRPARPKPRRSKVMESSSFQS